MTRINIQYSIDMDDLEKEVERLLSQSLLKIENINLEEARANKELMSLFTMKQIDEIRKELADIDHTLRDVSEIIASYVAYRVQSASIGHPVIDADPEMEALKGLQNDEIAP
tara:strand:+ start:644 stop:979 length:336 start_codon:yes stop_codon:yes gene_type:complete